MGNVCALEGQNNMEEKTSREWTAIRGECVSGGQLTEDCNLVAAAHGADLEVVMKKLVCGCLLVPSNEDGDIFL